MKDVMERITAMIEPTINAMGYELVGVEFASSHAQAVLRVYIDKEKGVAVEDCQNVSKQISGVLDVEEPIKGAYCLEVSSPGIDRPLFKAQDYVRFTGKMARIQLKQLLSERRNFLGRLQGIENDNVLIEVDGESWRLPFIQIRKAHLVAEL
jgi:ribosome maturation factor RimP